MSDTAEYREVSDYESMLECLENERVVSFVFESDHVMIAEGCDDWFKCKFTYPQMWRLISELQEKLRANEPST